MPHAMRAVIDFLQENSLTLALRDNKPNRERVLNYIIVV
jgi:hypothetical protein